MKAITAIIALALSGCAYPEWTPKYDPRSAKHPREIVRDTLECERLMQTVDGFNGVPKHERADFTLMNGNVRVCMSTTCAITLPQDYNPMAKCMAGRGHQILNW